MSQEPDKIKYENALEYMTKEMFKKDPLLFIQAHTLLMREANSTENFKEEIAYGYGITSGRYEQRFDMQQEERQDNLSAVKTIANYARVLIKIGTGPVNLVDFAGGAGQTFTEAAIELNKEISEGQVNMTVSNFRGKLTLDDLLLPEISNGISRETRDKFIKVLKDGLINYAVADILELKELMKGQPVHLMFMVNIFPYTVEYNDYILKIVSEILDSQYGTLIMGLRSLPGGTHYREENPYERVRNLIQAGFNPPSQTPYYSQNSRQVIYTPFQASMAPKLIPVST